MARIDWVDRRLQQWAQWLTTGDGAGYARCNPLHPTWSPPTAASHRPTTTANPQANHARQTHAAILRLSPQAQTALLLHYCAGIPPHAQAQQQACNLKALQARLRKAHARLAADFGQD